MSSANVNAARDAFSAAKRAVRDGTGTLAAMDAAFRSWYRLEHIHWAGSTTLDQWLADHDAYLNGGYRQHWGAPYDG